MPSIDLFEQQSDEYKQEILPNNVRARVAVEAGSDFGWGKYVGLDGALVTMTTYGASGPANQLFEKFGFTVNNVVCNCLRNRGIKFLIITILSRKIHIIPHWISISS